MKQNKTTDDPPLTLADPDKVLIALIFSIIIFLIAFVLFIQSARVPDIEKKEVKMENCFLVAREVQAEHMEFLGGEYLSPISPPFLVEGEIQAILIEKTPIKETDEELMNRIVMCESTWDPLAVNSEYGATGGMGLCGLIPMTVKECSGVFGRQINPFNPEDNLECCYYLLETYGTKPWGTAETWWGSYDCWHK